MTSAKDWVEALRQRIREVPVAQIAQEPQRWLVVDVREPEEWSRGHLPMAHHLSRGFLELRIEQLCADRKQPIALYCRSGVRSLLAAEAVERLGYREVVSVAGGYLGWVDAGQPFLVEAPPAPEGLDQEEEEAPAPSGEGTSPLRQTDVLVAAPPAMAAAAGLGLADAGCGTLAVAETGAHAPDRGEIDPGLGPDATTARRQILAALPGTVLAPAPAYITATNAAERVAGADLVVAAASSAPPELLDACATRKRPCVLLRETADAVVFGIAIPGEACPRCVVSALASIDDEGTEPAGVAGPVDPGDDRSARHWRSARRWIRAGAATAARRALEPGIVSQVFRQGAEGATAPRAVAPLAHCSCG